MYLIKKEIIAESKVRVEIKIDSKLYTITKLDSFYYLNDLLGMEKSA